MASLRTDIITENRIAAAGGRNAKGARRRGLPLQQPQLTNARVAGKFWQRYGLRMPKIKELECSRCKATVSAETLQTVCPKCAGAFYVRYDLAPMRGEAARARISALPEAAGWAGMWRYRSVLPEVEPVTLGEGW